MIGNNVDISSFLEDEGDKELSSLYRSWCPQCHKSQFAGENSLCEECKDEVWGY